MEDFERFENKDADVGSILVDTGYKVSEYVNNFTVQSKAIKSAFAEMQVLMKKTAYSKIVEFSYKNGVFTIRASTSVAYSTDVTILGDKPNNDFEVVCLFEDLAEILPGSGLLDITVSTNFIRFETKNIDVNLTVCNSEVIATPVIYGQGIEASVPVLIEALRKLLSLTAISNTFNKGNTLIFSGDVAQVRYPTIWVQYPSSSLETILDLSSAQVLEKFLANCKEVIMYDCDGYIAMKKDQSTLYLPKQSVVNISPLEEYIEGASFVGNVNLTGLSVKVQSLLKTVGKADCNVYIFQNAVKVESRTSSIVASVFSGDVDNSGDLIDTFTIRLEFLNNLLHLIDDVVKLSRKGNTICIQGQRVIIVCSLK